MIMPSNRVKKACHSRVMDVVCIGTSGCGDAHNGAVCEDESNAATPCTSELGNCAPGNAARRRSPNRKKKDDGYEKALRHWRSCEYDLARQSFEEFLDEKPMHSLAWVSYSRLVLSQSGFNAARRVLFKGIQNAGTNWTLEFWSHR